MALAAAKNKLRQLLRDLEDRRLAVDRRTDWGAAGVALEARAPWRPADGNTSRSPLTSRYGAQCVPRVIPRRDAQGGRWP